ncbi:MAG TPA: type II toxin-antitoxin system VapC family toxin [bacterium]|nr:type II toxin-antitoxin system VapC family toxin [bacterium]
MANLIVDTSVYVDFFRGKIPKNDPLAKLLTGLTHSLYLSSVVAQELLMGAGAAQSVSHLERFFGNFEAFGRIVTPTRQDWFECGLVLSKLGAKFGFETVGRSRLVNDVLIALSCVQTDARLVTFNRKDFDKISEFVDLEIESSVGEG